MDQPSFHFFMDHCEVSPEFTQTGCTILHNTLDGQLVLMKEIDLNQDDNVDDMIDILLKQKELYHDHLLSLIDFYPALAEGKMVKFYEYCSHTLLQEIESRAETGNPFSEEELENILVSGLKLLQYLQEAEIGHGCVSPLDICLSDDLVKVVDPSIASSNPLQIAEGYYYSPEMMECIVRGSEEDIDVFKNDVFSLAMCILHCGLLGSCHDCYDYDRGEFIFERLEEKVGELNEIYSEKLVRVLIRMLDEDVSARPDSAEVLRLIEEEFEEGMVDGGEEGKNHQQYPQHPHSQHQYTQQKHPQLQYQQNQEQEEKYQDYPEQYQQYEEPLGYYHQRGVYEEKVALHKTENNQPSQYEYAVEESLSMDPKPSSKLQPNTNQNSSSIANINISKTQERLASMISRAKMNIHRIRENNPPLQ